MTRLQILELPTGPGDDRPQFVLVVDEYMPLRYAIGIGMEERVVDEFEGVAEKIGARTVLVFREPVEIPGNTAPMEVADGPEREMEPEDAPDCRPGCCVDNDSFVPTTCSFCGSRERCVNHPGEEALARGVPGHPFSPSGPQPDEPTHTPDELRELVGEARQWARHGYEIGQRHCGWTDHGVAPAWLTEDWPAHFDSCEHLKKAAELEETIARVRAASTTPQVMNADQERADVWLHGYGIGVRAAKAALYPRNEPTVKP
jgi:hypothetical protein